jgi:3-dehydroquinate synthase
LSTEFLDRELTGSATLKDSLRVDLGNRSYDILIGGDLLSNPASYSGLPSVSSVMVVSNTTVAPLLAEPVMQALCSIYPHVHLVELPDGECYKDWTTLQLIFDALLSHACGRQTLLVALGGGVVGDMCGFAAACYMRGIPFVQVPTTLLAQVDSSVGGKTGINYPLGKNMIGAFYQPQRVIADVKALRTLPERELRAGLAEVIKYGLIADPAFLNWIEEHLDALLCQDTQALSHAVRRCCEIKAAVVAQDERESGLRAILNFGHTFGHAIEAGLGFGKWLHGEAVACGMLMAADLSARLKLIDTELVSRLCRLLLRAGLPVQGPPMSTEHYLALMQHDKKTVSSSIRYVLLKSVGQATVRTVEDAMVVQTLTAYGAT